MSAPARAIIARRGAAALALFAIALPAACEPPPEPVDPVAHRASVDAWKEKRYASLQRPDGWLSLVALHWLGSGSRTVGSDASNDLAYVSPSGLFPARVGTFHVGEDTIRFEASTGVEVRAVDSLVTHIVMAPAIAPDSTTPRLHTGSVQWTVIRRAGRFAVRMWDAESPVRTRFAGIEMYEVTPAWRLPARFIRHEPPDTIDVPNILGGENRTPSPASVRFEVNGRRYTLDLWKDADDLANFFTAFGDATNGNGTYGGGRFLWIDAPDENGRTIVDFNRAYNPPCVFTEFATCPLPPRQNRLPFPVEAGEKDWKAR
ncbi:MAG: DUF1684 domain-containing protein [Gemmatimonadetes bacterium]|nr:DUF1684 domain-containing protein [Gemmatimonadota bacterium]